MEASLVKKILFADDDEAFRFTMKEYFSDSPWTLDMAENGVVALDKAINTKYDLIILDINMPFMKGNEAVKEVKHKWPGVKVLAFTAFASHDVVDQYIRDGFDDVISKNIELGLLHKIISEHLGIAGEKKSEESLRTAAIYKAKLDDRKPHASAPVDRTDETPAELLLKRIRQLEQEKEVLMTENKILKERVRTLDIQLKKMSGLP